MYCTKCGAAMADGAVFCSVCGQKFSVSAGAAPMINAPAAVVPAYAGASVALAAPRVEYAGFWLRFFAYVIDNFILGAAVVLILIPVFFLTGLGALLSHIRPEEELGDAGAFVIVGFVFLALVASLLVTWLYHAMLESSQWQATVGKRMLGMVVTDTVGQRVSFGRATGRHFGKIITNMVPLFIGYIMAGFTEKKQALHDMLAGCFVLRRIS